MNRCYKCGRNTSPKTKILYYNDNFSIFIWKVFVVLWKMCWCFEKLLTFFNANKFKDTRPNSFSLTKLLRLRSWFILNLTSLKILFKSTTSWPWAICMKLFMKNNFFKICLIFKWMFEFSNKALFKIHCYLDIWKKNICIFEETVADPWRLPSKSPHALWNKTTLHTINAIIFSLFMRFLFQCRVLFLFSIVVISP